MKSCCKEWLESNHRKAWDKDGHFRLHCPDCGDKIVSDEPQFCTCEKPREDISNGIHPNHCVYCRLPIREKIKKLNLNWYESDAERAMAEKVNEIVSWINGRCQPCSGKTIMFSFLLNGALWGYPS